MAISQISNAGIEVGSQYIGFKNRIINGDMRIDQRNAGASVAISSSGTYLADRWVYYGVTGKCSIQQRDSLDTSSSNYEANSAPGGFKNSLKFTTTSAYTVAANEISIIGQKIEGYNLQDLMWGTANAQPISVSFWVKSSIVGVFAGTIINGAPDDYSYVFNYSINSANTWEYKTVVIPGAITGTWIINNNSCLILYFSLASGSGRLTTANTWTPKGPVGTYLSTSNANSLLTTNGATFYITGVQLEKGFVATSFDYRDYGRELQMCQRYYYKSPLTAPGDIFQVYQTNAGIVSSTSFPVTMRATPSLTFGYSTPYSGNTFYRVQTGGVSTWTLTDTRANANRVYYVYDNSQSGLVLGDAYSTYLTAIAEL